VSKIETLPGSVTKAAAAAPAIEFARYFLRLANLSNFALDRLSHYEATLWRQAGRILLALEVLDRCKPQDRGHCFCVLSKLDEMPVGFSPRRAGLFR